MVAVRSHLWFHDNGYQAAQFYASVIPGTEITRVIEAPSGLPDVPEGAPFVVEISIAGVPFTFLTAGPDLTLDDAFSIYLDVDGQDEVDHYWEALTADGGRPGPCGWLVDRFGVSWQVVPVQLEDIMGRPDAEGVARASAAMLTMSKLDVAALEAAYSGT